MAHPESPEKSRLREFDEMFREANPSRPELDRICLAQISETKRHWFGLMQRSAVASALVWLIRPPGTEIPFATLS